jgi:hypothetical protein
MAKLADRSEPPPEPPSKEFILERLEHWRCELVAFDLGASNQTRSRREIVVTLDRWLDELLEQRGR